MKVDDTVVWRDISEETRNNFLRKMDWGKQAIQPTNLHNRIKYWSNSLQIDQQMNFLSSTEQVSAQKPVAVSEIFSHLDADNAVSGTLSLYEFDFDNNHVSKWMRYSFVVNG